MKKYYLIELVAIIICALIFGVFIINSIPEKEAIKEPERVKINLDSIKEKDQKLKIDFQEIINQLNKNQNENRKTENQKHNQINSADYFNLIKIRDSIRTKYKL